MLTTVAGTGSSKPSRPGSGGAPSASAALLSVASATFLPHRPIAERAMAYLDKSPDPFHATQNACDRLAAAGFVAIDEKDAWTGKLAKGGRYYFTRNRSCIVAFAVGGAYEPERFQGDRRAHRLTQSTGEATLQTLKRWHHPAQRGVLRRRPVAYVV